MFRVFVSLIRLELEIQSTYVYKKMASMIGSEPVATTVIWGIYGSIFPKPSFLSRGRGVNPWHSLHQRT